MSQFPIVLIPDAINEAKNSLPPLSLPPAPKSPETPQPPPSLPNPPQSIEWGLIGTLIGIGLLFTFLLLGVAGWIAWISFLIMAAVSGGAGIWSVQSYPQRQEDYQKQKRKHSSETIRYQQALAVMPERKQKYEVELRDYTKKIERLKAKHANSEEVAIFRCDRLRQALTATQPYDGTNSNAQRGYSEAILEKYLRRYFGSNIYTGLTLAIPNSEHLYSPDFAYIDRSLNLHIDIEIDEPYIYKSGKPIHCIDEDESRNRFFLGKRWLVIRFCEQQVVEYPERCCKRVACEINDLIADSSFLQQFTGIVDLEPIPQWTYEEAMQMSRGGFRNTYKPTTSLSSAPRKTPQTAIKLPQSSSTQNHVAPLPANKSGQEQQDLGIKAKSKSARRSANKRNRYKLRQILNNCQNEAEAEAAIQDALNQGRITSNNVESFMEFFRDKDI